MYQQTLLLFTTTKLICEKMNRINSGILNLDKLVDGGIPKRNMVLVSGDYGTGKTTLGLQFIANGIAKHGELGVFVSFVNDKDEILEIGRQFGWQLKRFEREKTFEVIDVSPQRWIKLLKDRDSSVEELVEEMLKAVDNLEADRLVIDSLNEFSKLFESETALKSQVARLRKELRNRNCTSILTSRGKANIEEVVDGVFVLHYDGELEKTRAIEVRKMRMTDHTDRMCPFEIREDGMIVTGPPKERSEEDEDFSEYEE